MVKKTDQDKTHLDRIKTGRWERQWSITKAGFTVGAKASTQMLGAAFLPATKRESLQKKILSEQSLYLANELGKLKGGVVKIGQIMALYGEHILPEEVTDAFRTLEEQTQSLSWQAIEPLLKSQLGKYYNDFEIDRVPIGAASLAQVHKARNNKTQEIVCLKIQYPGVADSIESDLASIVSLLKMSRMINMNQQLEEWLDEVKRLLHCEIDYLREAEMTQQFAVWLHDETILKVPIIYNEYCTSQLLVSSYESGVAVNDASVLLIDQQQRNQLAYTFLALFMRELFEWGCIQTDPNFGNYRIQVNEKNEYSIVLLDFGAVLYYEESFLTPVKRMIIGASLNDKLAVRKGAIAFGMMQESYPQEVHDDFFGLCQLLVEPFTYRYTDAPSEAVSTSGEYRFAHSDLPKRAAKYAAKSALSQYFAIPPKEFAFLSRKLLGVYSFLSALEAEFDPQPLLESL